jgi:polyhydroxyalkanoate synthase
MHALAELPQQRSDRLERFGDGNPADANEWLAQARQHEGSWWPHWWQWLAALGDGQVDARSVGNTKYPPLMDAPGSYVLDA